MAGVLDKVFGFFSGLSDKEKAQLTASDPEAAFGDLNGVGTSPPPQGGPFVGPPRDVDVSGMPMPTKITPENGHPTYLKTTPAQKAQMLKPEADIQTGLLGGTGKKAPPPAAVLAGADVAKTGSMFDPTALMTDDADLAKFRAAIDKFDAQPRQTNLKPLLALTDAWTGSRLADAYAAPQTEEQHQANMLALREKLYEKEADSKYRKAHLAQSVEASRSNDTLRRDQMQHDTDLLRERLASNEKIAGMKRARGGGGTPKFDTKGQTFVTSNKRDLTKLIIEKYGKKLADGTPDPDWKIPSGLLEDVGTKIFVEGKAREKDGRSPPGRGIAEAWNEEAGRTVGLTGGGGGGGGYPRTVRNAKGETAQVANATEAAQAAQDGFN